jgi:hypothetical protein
LYPTSRQVERQKMNLFLSSSVECHQLEGDVVVTVTSELWEPAVVTAMAKVVEVSTTLH